uniref:M1-specific T cell receptor beta chain-like n=1 Tax=Oncorhynchus gorbuscha TaxID=8017 RepID=UPI001EAF314C|nr:M1-specific T cell receptor beta chain-like [Oncorhynchus gorbuscha]
MFKIFTTFLVCLSFLSEEVVFSSSLLIRQTPQHLLRRTTEHREAHLDCHHGDNDYPYMLWYQQKDKGGQKTMELIGTLHYTNPTLEKNYETRFNLTGHSKAKASAVYYCAASQHSALVHYCSVCPHCDNYNPALFGAGTKLTVLEPDIPVTPPKVKVLPPSTKECEDRNKKKKKTLVCVATDFYPDHVTVFWKLNGGANITDGVGTDNTALRDENRRYSITSRLRVPAKTWNTASNRFTCAVRFFNGTDNIYVADHINGEGGGDGGMTTEYYVKSTQTAKLAYSIFIAKSTFYGLVVVALIWKFQRSSDKQM